MIIIQTILNNSPFRYILGISTRHGKGKPGGPKITRHGTVTGKLAKINLIWGGRRGAQHVAKYRE